LKHRSRHKRLEVGEAELNLVPMLDLFLSLIPFLLISAVFLNYGGLFVEAPSFTPTNTLSQNESLNPDSQEINLLFRVDGDQVTVSGYAKGFLAKVPEVNASFATNDRDGLKQYISKVMNEHKKISSVLFKATPTTKYEQAVVVLNIVKSLKVSSNVVLAVRNIE
jgi:biopolymer transport protein ExbD